MGNAPSFVQPEPPDDGREYDCQCARCGSSVEFVTCESCEEGVVDHDCGEDTCACAEPEANVSCDICGGNGSYVVCVSTVEWCDANPLAGREKTPPNTPEWFALDERRVAS